jgi:hypothetical protein
MALKTDYCHLEISSQSIVIYCRCLILIPTFMPNFERGCVNLFANFMAARIVEVL